MFEVLAVVCRDLVVPIDSRLPNSLFHMALTRGELEPFASYPTVQREHRYGKSRFDFLLSSPQEKCLVEVKSCTLVRDGVALFPDAPTLRGRRHVEELVKAKQEGYRACIAFIVQRNDAIRFRSFAENDALFAAALLEASLRGVEVFAWKVKKVDESLLVSLDGQIPVLLHL